MYYWNGYFNLGIARKTASRIKQAILNLIYMGRGRPSKVSDERLLIELLLHPDRAVFTSQISDKLPVSSQTVRDRMDTLAEQSWVEIEELDGGNLYRLTDDGLCHVATLLRDQYQ